MEYKSFFENLKITKPDDCFCDVFEKAYCEYSKNGVFFLNEEFLDDVNSACACFENCYNDLKNAIISAKANEDISIYALFLFRAMEKREMFLKHLEEFVFPKGKGKEYDFLPMLVFLPVIPRLYKNLKERKIPDDIIKATLCQFEDCVYLYEERFGKTGLNKRYFDHLQLYVDEEILNIGRLRFQMVKNLKSCVLVLKNKKGELVVLANGMKINPKGMLFKTPPIDDNEAYFETFAEEQKDCFVAHKVLKNGRVSDALEKFSKKEWEVAIKKGDSVLSVHIPNKGALTKEACKISYEMAKKVFKECYKEFDFKGFHSHTWLFDPKLKEFLPPDSNIVGFAEKYTIYPGETLGEDVFNFVFKLKFTEFSDMPEDTSLQRAIKEHYLEGKYIYEYEGIFLQ